MNYKWSALKVKFIKKKEENKTEMKRRYIFGNKKKAKQKHIVAILRSIEILYYQCDRENNT